MRVRLWGTRGSLAAPGPDTARFGGNTSSIEVRGTGGTVLILDAGTGIRRLGAQLAGVREIHIILSHLHMDHIQGLGFFAPVFDPAVNVRLWGPAASTEDLRRRLARYLSPPLFPVHLRDVRGLTVSALPTGDFDAGEFRVRAERVCHPGLTVGIAIATHSHRLAYLSDHEPALGARRFPARPDWTSGYSLAHRADLLLHDAQYAAAEYPTHVGWGHSSIDHAITFADFVEAQRLVTIHHDPAHNDATIEALTGEAVARLQPRCLATAGAESDQFEL